MTFVHSRSTQRLNLQRRTGPIIDLGLTDDGALEVPGDPLLRSPESVREDVRQVRVTADAAEDVYGSYSARTAKWTTPRPESDARSCGGAALPALEWPVPGSRRPGSRT